MNEENKKTQNKTTMRTCMRDGAALIEYWTFSGITHLFRRITKIWESNRRQSIRIYSFLLNKNWYQYWYSWVVRVFYFFGFSVVVFSKVFIMYARHCFRFYCFCMWFGKCVQMCHQMCKCYDADTLLPNQLLIWSLVIIRMQKNSIIVDYYINSMSVLLFCGP